MAGYYEKHELIELLIKAKTVRESSSHYCV